MRHPPARLLWFILTVLLLGPGRAAAQPAGPDRRFGVVGASQAPWAAAELGVGWTTVTFRWDEVQPNSPQQWNPPLSDQGLALEASLGRQVVGLVVGTAVWAADPERRGVPRGLDLDPSDPGNLWAGFLRALVARYAGRIDHWIIWDRPDVRLPAGVTWTGSVEDFARLLRVSYSVVKTANPNGVVHLPALTHWEDARHGREPFLRRLLEVLAQDPEAASNNFYFDVATLNAYFQPENLYDLTRFYRSLMREYGLDPPIWIGETGAATSEDPAVPVPDAPFTVSLQDQASFVVQALALALAGGAERVAVYRLQDNDQGPPGAPEPFGLQRADGTRRPAFTACQVALTYLAGARSARWVRRDQVSVVVIDRVSQTTTVVWSRTPEPHEVMLQARTTRALLVDIRGGARLIHPDRGYYPLTLDGCSYQQECLIGGTPLMLVEEVPAGNLASVAGSPEMGWLLEVPLPPTLTPTPSATPVAPAPVMQAKPSPGLSPATPLPSPSPTAAPSPASGFHTPARALPPYSLIAAILAGGLGLAGLAGRRRR